MTCTKSFHRRLLEEITALNIELHTELKYSLRRNLIIESFTDASHLPDYFVVLHGTLISSACRL